MNGPYVTLEIFFYNFFIHAYFMQVDMQNGLKRMRTSDPPSVTNSNQISDTIQQDFPLTSNTNANSCGGGNGRSSGGGATGNGNRQIREPASQQQHQKHDSMKSRESQHPLFTRGVCTWAGCETTCDTYPAFISHLNREHVLDERSTAQTRVQVKHI
jgi:hypothetical protein